MTDKEVGAYGRALDILLLHKRIIEASGWVPTPAVAAVMLRVIAYIEQCAVNALELN